MPEFAVIPAFTTLSVKLYYLPLRTVRQDIYIYIYTYEYMYIYSRELCHVLQAEWII